MVRFGNSRPKGAELGSTEVVYLTVKGETPGACCNRTDAIFDQIESQRRVRQDNASDDPEAIAPHLLNNLIPKMSTVQQSATVDDDANTASTWTPYQPTEDGILRSDRSSSAGPMRFDSSHCDILLHRPLSQMADLCHNRS